MHLLWTITIKRPGCMGIVQSIILHNFQGINKYFDCRIKPNCVDRAVVVQMLGAKDIDNFECIQHLIIQLQQTTLLRIPLPVNALIG